MTITEFLLARIAEADRAAKALEVHRPGSGIICANEHRRGRTCVMLLAALEPYEGHPDHDEAWWSR